MADETNGDKKGRLDRVEGLLDLLVHDHIQFREESCQLLKALVLLRDKVRASRHRVQARRGRVREPNESLEQRLAAMRAAQRNTDKEMAALIALAQARGVL